MQQTLRKYPQNASHTLNFVPLDADECVGVSACRCVCVCVYQTHLANCFWFGFAKPASCYSTHCAFITINRHTHAHLHKLNWISSVAFVCPLLPPTPLIPARTTRMVTGNTLATNKPDLYIYIVAVVTTV